jgi:hypothetical protein
MGVALAVTIAIAGVFLGIVLVRLVWRGVGLYRISRAGPRRLVASRHRIWRHPGDLAALDLSSGPGGVDGVPVPPFHFIQEHTQGSQPCCSVRDGRGRTWRVKWGPEVHSETFAVRLAHACGYFAEVTHLVRAGTIAGAAALTTTRDCIDVSGAFADARFELEESGVRKLFEEHSWAWNDNPFVGSRELSGLKLVVMLLSNWDTKDRRDVARGSNTAIFEHPVSRWRREARYLITDWGGSMGRWGSNVVTRDRWDADGFAAQTRQFVTGRRDGCLQFGYAGQRTADIAANLRVEHARWFYRHARAITRPQLIDALAASGATADEQRLFADALLDRIRQIGEAARAE